MLHLYSCHLFYRDKPVSQALSLGLVPAGEHEWSPRGLILGPWVLHHMLVKTLTGSHPPGESSLGFSTLPTTPLPKLPIPPFTFLRQGRGEHAAAWPLASPHLLSNLAFSRGEEITLGCYNCSSVFQPFPLLNTKFGRGRCHGNVFSHPLLNLTLGRGWGKVLEHVPLLSPTPRPRPNELFRPQDWGSGGGTC